MNNSRSPFSVKAHAAMNFLLVVAIAAGLVFTTQPAGTVQAAAGTSTPVTITVNTFSDAIAADGKCSLREAIIAANTDRVVNSGTGECPAGGGGADVIAFAQPGTYSLSIGDNGKDSPTTGDLDITADLTINGAGATQTIISGAGANFANFMIHIQSGTTVINNLTVQGGLYNGDGGGINNQAKLTLNNVVITSNRANGRGGGILNVSNGILEINNSTIANNIAQGGGGGIATTGGTVTINNSTISGNQAFQTGGGIYQTGGTVNLNNVTIANNVADSDLNGSGDGGGVSVASSSVLNATNTIIAANLDKSSSGIYPDCVGIITSKGYTLVQNLTGCTLGGVATGNLSGVDAQLGPLQNNGGQTLTQAPLASSPAVDAGSACLAKDQRGVTRPQGSGCDMGAVEVENPLQRGPLFTVTNTDDTGGMCLITSCSLRQAILAANARPNGAAPDQIVFNLPGGGAQTISPRSALPVISDPVVIDATTVANQLITLDGAQAGSSDGLVFSGGGSTVRGLTITHFAKNGIVISSSGNTVIGNTITANGQAGVVVVSGSGNVIKSNLISGNGGLGIDLGGNGVVQNDSGDGDGGANTLQNYPVLVAAVPGAASTVVLGRLNSLPNSAYTLEFFSNQACDASGFGPGSVLIGSAAVTTNAAGNATFNVTLPVAVAQGRYVTATATGAGGTSEFSRCLIAGARNDSWPNALELTPGAVAAGIDQFLDKPGQVRWYKFKIQPNSKIIATLTHLPANYDLTLYKDIGQAFGGATSVQDLNRLGAEFAGDGFAPDTFSPDTFSPDTFSPDTFSPDTFSPDTFSPDTFSPDTFSPDTFSPDTFSPDTFSPDTFSPDTFSPDTFSPDTFSPDTFSPISFSNAQSRSLIGVSGFDGTTSEGVAVNTWENTGYFYARVRGRNGAYDLNSAFHFEVTLAAGQCSDLNANLPATSTVIAAAGRRTLILVDWTRLSGSPAEIAALQDKLNSFAGRPEIAGLVVDVSGDARVAAANAQADARPACPSAKNLVAASVKNIVNAAAQNNPLEYIVIAGSDNVIPFFRHADQSLLANERNYVPPVRDSSPSQASLKLGYFLSQDDYGSQLSLPSKSNTFSIPNLAVGRLVETPAEIQSMLDAYLSTQDGVVNTPSSALVTGYDFLADAAEAIQSQLQVGLGAPVKSLITDRSVAPTSPLSWTAADLRTALLGSRSDLVFLGGHFSSASALAADYSTRLMSTEVLASQISMLNTIIFSAGCHAGYNLVNADGIPQVTPGPDWAQVFAAKGATLIAGTGYQYGDTDFIEYSERLYLEFSKQLLVGSGPVSLGKALVAAKQVYLANTPDIRGLHEKAVLEATLFGLPMLSVNLPAGRVTPASKPAAVTSLNTFTSNPGKTLGLAYADLAVNPQLSAHSVDFKDPNTGAPSYTATYYSGSDGTVSRPAEPVLPLETRNVSVDGTALRGVGLRGGSYSDAQNVLPLTGAITTEVRGVHSPFFSDFFFPVRFWNVNYFGALTGAAGGQTQLMVQPAQFMSNLPGSLTGTLRSFNGLSFRLFYSANTATSQVSGGTPALSAAPTIASVTSSQANGSVTFRERVTGDPAAGIQQVWVTYTALSGPFAGSWQSLDLAQNPGDTTLWEGSLPLAGTNPDDFRYIVQAVNGVGLVSLATNLGAYYIPGYEAAVPTTPTSLALSIPPAGAYGSDATFRATLTSGGAPLAGKRVAFGVGPLSRQAVTDANGVAAVTMPLLASPDTYTVRASFSGSPVYLASNATGNYTITKQSTQLTLSPAAASAQYSDPNQVVATLLDGAGLPVPHQTVVFIVTGGSTALSLPVITDYAGRAPLGALNLAPGSYTVAAYFNGLIPLPGGAITLEDYRYTSSNTTGSLAVTSEDATLAYTGPDKALANSPLTLSATVSQAADGTSGDLTLATVQFSVLNNGTQVASVSAAVNAAGSASATLPAGLPAGLYQVTASLQSAAFTAAPVSAQLAVYDPKAGLLAGLGEFTSPVGAYQPNPSLTGTTSYALATYYATGALTPSGLTYLQFKAGSLTFSSTSYDWLVVSGTHAYLKGSGKVNSTGSYGFLISTVVNAGTTQQLFRVKIWEKATGSVLYDTQPGAADTAEPTTATTGLSIIYQ